jgi:hypothetical protein
MQADRHLIDGFQRHLQRVRVIDRWLISVRTKELSGTIIVASVDEQIQITTSLLKISVKLHAAMTPLNA